MSKNWTPRKISAFCNKLIRLLKQAGIHVHRFDISKWGQAVLNIGDSFVAGLDFPRPAVKGQSNRSQTPDARR